MFELRYYQEEAIQSIFDYFARFDGNPVIALPTGTGKSLVIAEFIRRVMFNWPGQRIMMLTHVKELIEQNFEKLTAVWPTAPAGIFSAGVGRKDTALPIIFGGVQSVVKAIEKFGWMDLLIVDECHLIGPNDETMYQKVISELKKVNPFLKVIGLSATPYRLKMGMITEGGIFTHVCYDRTDVMSFNRLIAEGFLAPLFPRPTETKIDLSSVSLVAGEYNQKQLAAASDNDKISWKACEETIRICSDRKAWMVFAADIHHAETLSGMLNSLGVDASFVHSKLSSQENTDRINAFKAGELTALVNMNKLTTGFDHPPTDLIVDLQATNSTSKYIQKAGRGTRPAPWAGKEYCVYLDFAGNVPRLGPINDPVIPGKPREGGGGDVIVKICENEYDGRSVTTEGCGTYNYGAARFCCCCGKEFKFKTKIFHTAGMDELIRTAAKEEKEFKTIEVFDVTKVMYTPHFKEGGKQSIKVTYFCKFKSYNFWVTLEGKGPARKTAVSWWMQHSKVEAPETTAEALRYVDSFRTPARIRVEFPGKTKDYPQVVGYEF
ncbi:DNA helicase [Erwinia phage AH03]|uniref:DNA helicase n=1 Tax=Erwinia phage AH03 TaxID=2869568 RepID=A0AAE8BQ76_9CAUD|nr:DNA helicase [Erwinia phage AH03]